MSTLGLYRPGRSPVHRLPAGAKLAALVAAGLGSVFLDRPWQVAVALGWSRCGYAVAHLPPRVLLRQARPLLWVLLLVGAFHVLVNGWERAVVVIGVILALVLLAGLVTLTTRTSDLIDALVACVGARCAGSGSTPSASGCCWRWASGRCSWWRTSPRRCATRSGRGG